MCGRYAASRRPEDLVVEFEAENATGLPLLPADYNVAPTKDVHAVLVRHGVRQLRVLRWGLVPSWAADASGGARMINARAETVAGKPAFRSLLAFAGLYEIRDNLCTCTIVTTAATRQLAALHDRMPVALGRAQWADWLDPDSADPGRLLSSPDPEVLTGVEVRPVGRAVGNVDNNGPSLLAAVPETVPRTLF